MRAGGGGRRGQGERAGQPGERSADPGGEGVRRSGGRCQEHPEDRVGSRGRRTRVRADEDETTEGRAQHQQPRPARPLSGGDALADGQQHRRETERHHRRDGDADGEDGAEVERLVGARAAPDDDRGARPLPHQAAQVGEAAGHQQRGEEYDGREHHPPGADHEHRHRLAIADELHDEAAGAPEHTGEGHLEEAEAGTAGGGRARETRGHGRAASDVGTRGRLSSSRSPTQMVGGVPLRSGSRRAYDEAVSDHVRDPATSQRSAPSSSRTNSWPRSPSIRVRCASTMPSPSSL